MKPDLIAIVANGKEEQVDQACSMEAFLTSRGWKTTQVVVEHNGHVLARAELGSAILRPGDRLEIIVPVAGG